jgi:hypothetical protein
VPAPAPAPVEVPTPTEPAVPTPAPAPVPEVAPVAPVKPTTTVQAPKPVVPKPLEIAKPVAEKSKTPEPAKPVKPVVEPKPEPVKPAKPVEIAKPVEPVKPAESVKPKSKTTIPQSKHVKVTAPARMQELLDADTRMQPWLNNTMGTIEACYADVLKSNASASGTITFVLEMHKNARPDADITTLPPQLSGIVTCATGKLMRAARMPLFTGDEGEKHTVRVKFSP